MKKTYIKPACEAYFIKTQSFCASPGPERRLQMFGGSGDEAAAESDAGR